jgi:hypothetical protein
MFIAGCDGGYLHNHQRDPCGILGGDLVLFPPEDPPVPAPLALLRFNTDGGMGHNANFHIFVMPLTDCA